MKKLIALAACGMLVACGTSDVSDGVQTYKTLLDAAQSDIVKTNEQVRKGVTVEFNVAEYSVMPFDSKVTLMRLEESSDVSKMRGLGLNFDISEAAALKSKSSAKAKCRTGEASSGMGTTITLTDCKII